MLALALALALARVPALALALTPVVVPALELCYLEEGGWQRLPDDSYQNGIMDACGWEALAQGLIEPTRMDEKNKRGQSSHRQARKPAGGTQACWPLVIVGGWEPHNTSLFGDLRLHRGGGARRGRGR